MRDVLVPNATEALMVTIIKRGKPPADIEYSATCSNCKTEFTFFRHEAHSENHDQREGSALIIACPVCGQDVWRAI